MKAKAIAFVMLILLAGVVAGVALDRLLLKPPMHGPPHGRHGPKHGPGGGPRHGPPERFFLELTSELDLTAEQQAQLKTVVHAAETRAHAIMDESRPKLDAAMQQTRDEVLALLTEAQRARFLEIEKQRPRPLPPRPPNLGPPHLGK